MRHAEKIPSKRSRTSAARRLRKRNDNARVLAHYKAEAKEIAAARQAMKRLHRGIEFEPERLHYVTDIHLS